MNMRTRVFVLRAVFIGLAIISGIFWLVWMFDINAYTKFQVLWRSIDMTMLRRILAGICLLSVCGVVATLNVGRRRYQVLAIAVLAAIYGVGVLISIKLVPETAYYAFHDSNRELVVMEEIQGERRQAVFYERKNPIIIEYLGNMDYYGSESAFASGNVNIIWKETGQVIVKLRAQFQNISAKNVAWSGESYMETRETKEQIFYVDGQ